MNVFPVWSFIVSLQENIGLRKLNRQSTLALISVEENAKRIDRRNSIYNKVRESPPPYDEVFNSRRSSVMSRISEQSASSSQSRSGKAITIVMPKKSNRVTPMDSREDIKLKCQSFWRRRPILKLFLVILFNGIASMAFAAVFIEVFILKIFKKLLPILPVFCFSLKNQLKIKEMKWKQTYSIIYKKWNLTWQKQYERNQDLSRSCLKTTPAVFLIIIKLKMKYPGKCCLLWPMSIQ